MKNVKFKTIYKTKKFSMFCKTKDSISMEQKSNVIYRIIFPGSFQKYVWKTIEISSPALTNIAQNLTS